MENNTFEFVDFIRDEEECIQSLLQAFSQRKSSLSPEVRVLVALRFYAQGSYQMSVAQDLTLAVCQKSVSNCVHIVTEAIVTNLAHQWIQFPSDDEIPLIRAQFYEKYHIHGVVGCIDCTHIYIASVPDDPIHREYMYVNRKNEHSINVQLICDASCRNKNVNSKFPGSTHDSFIWKNSEIRNYLKDKYEEGTFKSWLLGDKGYPLEPFLMVPFQENEIQPHSKEENYNRIHKKTRSIIERVNGQLKGRFRCLIKHRILHYRPQFVSLITIACCVLHNMCKQANLADLDLHEELDIEYEKPIPINVNEEIGRGRNSFHRLGQQIRSQIVNQLR
ncbi:putative nuclease HARBI1 [Aphis gossypii]|uniref:putative nuclease HARBI1 n=1 Tax=Aphis gossypii TaxID=80765 RepID=UPI002159A78D|nr:putative nuclease HARBI1 [Aphis gossypii]